MNKSQRNWEKELTPLVRQTSSHDTIMRRIEGLEKRSKLRRFSPLIVVIAPLVLLLAFLSPHLGKILNFVSDTQEGQSTVENPKQDTAELPKEFNYNGRTINIDKVRAEVGDRGKELANWLTESRNIIDGGGDLTAQLSPKHTELTKIFPEINLENQRIIQEGILSETNKSPVKGWNQDKQQKYEQLKKLDVIPFLHYISGLADNAGMHGSRNPQSALDNEKIKLARDTFDFYSRFFSEAQSDVEQKFKEENSI